MSQTSPGTDPNAGMRVFSHGPASFVVGGRQDDCRDGSARRRIAALDGAPDDDDDEVYAADASTSPPSASDHETRSRRLPVDGDRIVFAGVEHQGGRFQMFLATAPPQ